MLRVGESLDEVAHIVMLMTAVIVSQMSPKVKKTTTL